jgi:glucose/arabinose dehydrogenase
MSRPLTVTLAAVLAGCASAPPPPPYLAEALAPPLTQTCPDAGAEAAELVPEGLAVVRSEGADIMVVAAGRCVLTIDLQSGQAAPLPLRGNLAAPVMVDATREGMAFGSRAIGATLRIQLGETTTTEMLSGFQAPQGVRLLPGGSVLVAEAVPGRVVRVGPTEESRPITIIDGLMEPVGVVVSSATTAYVTERAAGQVTRFALRTGEHAVVATGLDHPEGLARLDEHRLVVAEAGAKRVVAVDTRDGALEVLADNLPFGDETTPDAVADVAVAPDGTIYVSSDLERTVFKLTRRP